ncbi:PDZ domain-containing protein [Streptomyces durmitorensis]|uniref:PDZ domain-containing protein n=1 Tax=Streptomyces durmitorensis TaxID=319947 RepID=A0ABY4PPN1_9ACTN|nr:PDZ domain-containing protein [Streptomyces durmitorensis]UQT55571.1 PDZ domain-containing protein [Streptomyces durmitorensis]
MEQTALRPKPMPGQDSGGGGKFGIGRKLGIGRKSGRGGGLGMARRLGMGRKAGARRTSGTGHRSGPGHRPHAARRRGRRLITLLLGLLFSAVLVLSGVGLGTVSATVIGMSKLADMQKQAQKQAQAQGGAKGQGGQTGPEAPGGPAGPGAPAAPGTASKPAAPPKPSKPPGKEPDKAGERAAARPAIGVEAVDAPTGPGALLVGVHSPGPGHTAGLVRGDVVLAFGGTRTASAKALAAAVAAAAPGRNVTVSVRHESGGRQSLSVTPGFVT